jgi:hypothetical protein
MENINILFIYLFILCFKVCFEAKYVTTVVDVCAPRTHPSCFTFTPTEKLALNYARSSVTHPSHKIRPHCNIQQHEGL